MFYWLIKWISWPLRALYFRIHVEGVEHFPASGPVIVVANHGSYLDPGIVGSILRRKVHFMVLSSMYAKWRLRWFYVGMETIPVNPGQTDAGAIRQALRVLQRGGVLGIFPEGARSLDGRLKRPLAGAAAIAVRSGALVVPAAIEGAFEAFPRGSWWPRPRRICVRIGRPFRLPPRSRDGRSRPQLDVLSQRIMREIEILLGRGTSGAPSAREDVR